MWRVAFCVAEKRGVHTDPCERNLTLAFVEYLISLLTAGTTIAMSSLHETITSNADIFVFLLRAALLLVGGSC